MIDFDLRPKTPTDDVWPEGIASEEVVAKLPPLAQLMIAESGQPAVLNPLLTDELARDALAFIAEMAQAIEQEKADYNASRGTLRAVCDFFLSTGKDDLFLTRPAAEEAISRALGVPDPESLVNHLWLAGLVAISDFVPEVSENAAGMLARFKEVITVTERGKILLDLHKQPEALLHG